MMRCKKMLSLVALVAPFAVGAVLLSGSAEPAHAARQSMDMCYVTGIRFDWIDGREGCVYAPPDALKFDADVCWNGQTARVKGSGVCLPTESQYYLAYGEVVDPLLGTVAAYAPVSDACDNAATCSGQYQGNEQLADGYACCDPQGNCWEPDQNGDCTVGDVTWCKEKEDDGQGGVNCHE